MGEPDPRSPSGALASDPDPGAVERQVANPCRICGRSQATHAVVTGAEFDDKGQDVIRPKHVWACKPCSKLPLGVILMRLGN